MFAPERPFGQRTASFTIKCCAGRGEPIPINPTAGSSVNTTAPQALGPSPHGYATAPGQSTVLKLYQIAKTVIARHIKVRGEADPYDPKYTEYFERRRSLMGRVLYAGRKAGQASPLAV